MYPNPKFEEPQQATASGFAEEMFQSLLNNPPEGMSKQEILDSMAAKALNETGVALFCLVQELKLFSIASAGLDRLLKEGAAITDNDNKLIKILIPSVNKVLSTLSKYKVEFSEITQFSDEGAL